MGLTIAWLAIQACSPGAGGQPTGAAGATQVRSPALVVTPQPVSAVGLASASVTGGGTVTGTVTLAGATGASTTVGLTVDTPAVASVPASIVIPAGNGSGAFTIVTSSVSTATTVRITATEGGASAFADLQVLPPTVVTGASAVIDDPGCRANTLPANDDGSTAAVTLPSPVNFFGTTYTFFYINNNGNVTFRQPLSTYTPFTITASVPPMIAPFFADVDTRGSGSSPVTYSFGPVQFGGRPAMCVDWVNVGYYASHFDKLNSFQLLLVDRGDRAAGDFDIVMNYDQIAWETGDASGGVNGFGGTPAGAGYSAGTGDASQFFQFPGSLAAGGLLDSNPTTALTRTTHGTLVLGRHIFPVHNGGAVGDASIFGTVTNAAMQPLVGAPVQVCSVTDGHCVFFTLTTSTGQYEATALLPGDYTVTAYPAAGSNGIVQSVPVHVTAGSTQTVNLVIPGPTPPPAGVTITPSTTTANGLPSVYWHSPLQLTAQLCAGGAVSYLITGAGGATFASGPMTESPLGTFTATVPPFAPNHGPAHVHIQATCPDGPPQTIDFDIYIDPSGVVRTVQGTPIAGAVVTIFRSDAAGGPFEAIPDGSAAMSPSNRRNPDLTDANGHFGWDVITGFYKVRAQATGCTSADGSQAFAESAVLPVPPAITDLDLRLACPDVIPPVTTATVDRMANAAGWYATLPTISLAAADEAGGSGVASIHYTASGATTANQVVAGASAQVAPQADGVTTLTYGATDNAGNIEAAHTLSVSIDRTPPTVACPATPAIITSATSGLVPVHVAASAQDAISGVASVVLTALTSSVALAAGDVSGFVVGQPSADGALRAGPDGRTYSLTYTATDVAGNTSTCVAQVQVQATAPPPPPPTDHTAPSCAVTKVVGAATGPRSILLTVGDTGSGLGTVQVVSARGANVVIPAFAAHATAPVVVTATMAPPATAETVVLRVTDAAGNQTTCAASLLHVARGSFIATADGVQGSEKTLTIYNGVPGALAIGVFVDDVPRTLERLRPGEVQSLDISRLLKSPTANRVSVVGATFWVRESADVLLWSGGTAPPPHS